MGCACELNMARRGPTHLDELIRPQQPEEVVDERVTLDVAWRKRSCGQQGVTGGVGHDSPRRVHGTQQV